jgi:hypothetical protein
VSGAAGVRLRLCAVTLLAVAVACQQEAAPDIRAPAAAPPAVAAADDWTGTVEVVLSEARQLDGSYRSSGAGCIRSPSGWIISHENTADRLRMTQAVIENIGDQGGTSPLVQLTVVLGDPTDETDRTAAMVMLMSDGTAAHGSGSGTVRRDGAAVQVGIQGRTAEGISVQAQYRCAQAG